jgi:WXG100 family type VII secretion target
MGEIKVTFGALEAARSDVAGTAVRVGGRLDELRRAVAPLAASWQGQAAQEYQARQRQWDTAAADLARVLVDIGRALAAAHDGYRATENANAGRWRGA